MNSALEMGGGVREATRQSTADLYYRRGESEYCSLRVISQTQTQVQAQVQAQSQSQVSVSVLSLSLSLPWYYNTYSLSWLFGSGPPGPSHDACTAYLLRARTSMFNVLAKTKPTLPRYSVRNTEATTKRMEKTNIQRLWISSSRAPEA